MRFTAGVILPRVRRISIPLGIVILALSGSVVVARAHASAPSPHGTPQLTCMLPTDVGALTRVLAASGSPLMANSADFVERGAAAGIDPRFLVAIAAQETVLATYPPAARIHNPFGIGPNVRFRTYTAAISNAAQLLAHGYLADGLTLIPQIATRWAPNGSANDPTKLNFSWAASVGRYYTELGGNPELPVTLAAQSGDCTRTISTTPLALTNVNPLGRAQTTVIQGPNQGTHNAKFNRLHHSYNWQSIYAVDLAVPYASPVYAVFSGTITNVSTGGTGRFAGISISLDSGHGRAAYYAHLSASSVVAGDMVVAGQLIGASGRANGVDHLHFATGRRAATNAVRTGLNPITFLNHASTRTQSDQPTLANGVQLLAGSGPLRLKTWGSQPSANLGVGFPLHTGSHFGVSGFAFPMKVRPTTQLRYLPPACTNATNCALTIQSPKNIPVVAAFDGTLSYASRADRRRGVWIWITTPIGTQIGYSPLHRGRIRIFTGTSVHMGQLLGTSTGTLSIRWLRGTTLINPWLALTLVRPSN